MSNFANSKPVVLKGLRAAWLDIYKPGDGMNGGAPKFKFTGILARDSEAAKVAKQAMLEAATGLWGANAQNVIKTINANSKALRDGNSKLNEDGSVREAFKDMLYLSASQKAESKPKVVGPAKINGVFVDIHQDGTCSQNGVVIVPPYPIVVPYRGCYVNVKCSFTAGKSFKGKGDEIIPNQIFCRFDAIQFVRDGEAFGAGPTSAEGFEDEDVPVGGAGKSNFDDMDDDIPF